MDNIKGTVIEACDQARSRPVLSLVCSFNVVKLRQGSGKDRQGTAVKAKGLKA